jgi:hypothetical protein
MGVVCGANKFHIDFYNEMHQKEVTVSGYTVLYVNWLESKLKAAQKENKEAEPSTSTNKLKAEIIADMKVVSAQCWKDGLEPMASRVEGWMQKLSAIE